MTSKGEKVFPRGGKNRALSKPSKAPSFSLFDRSFKKDSKKLKKKSKKKNVRDHSGSSEKNNSDIPRKIGLTISKAEDLNPRQLHEGMSVLGIVSQVTEKFVNLSLPGGIKGIVSLKDVSEFYKNLIVNSSSKSEVPSLSEIFSVGDVVPSKVVAGTDYKFTFLMTLDPKLINAKLGDIETGMIIVGSIKSEEDHGYIVDFGVRNIKGFLNFDKIENNKRFKIGKLVRCIVVKSICAQGSYNLDLSVLDCDVQTGKLSSDSCYPLHSFVPGMQFQLTVRKVLKNGLEVSFRDDSNMKGYVHEDQLPSLFPNLSKIKEGAKYTGTLLYVKPFLNVPYFKIFSFKPQNWIFHYGQIVKGKVFKANRSGVYFRIGKKLLPTKCFVPFLKLADTNKLLEEESIIDKYPEKKVVDEIRLGCIDYMRRCYVGYTDKSSLEEKYSSIYEINYGEIVPCKVLAINDNSIKVKIGKTLTGVIGFEDVTDFPVQNIGSRFKIDQSIRARVLETDLKTRFIRLTMKPTLMKQKFKILGSYFDAKPNEKFTGSVVKAFPKKILVKFFNDVVGIVPKELTPQRGATSLTDHYVPGQLVKCLVVNCVGEHLILSLLSKEEIDVKFERNEKYEVVVSEKQESGLVVDVQLKENGRVVQGYVPGALLSDYPGIGMNLIETYSIKDRFAAYYVFQKKGRLPVFAPSESLSQFYDTLETEKTPPEELLKVGQVLPFLYSHLNEKTRRIVLNPVVQGHEQMRFSADPSKVFSKELIRDGKLPIKSYQLLYGVIRRISEKFVQVSIGTSDVWDKDFHGSLNLLDFYLNGMKKLIDHHRKCGKGYIQRATLGAVVRNVSDKPGVVCELGSLKEKSKGDVSGRIVWIKPESEVLCLYTGSSNADCKDGDLPEEETVSRARIVYVGEEVIVASLKAKGKGKLVFVPRKRHVNDFENTSSPYDLGCETTLFVKRTASNNYVAVDREIMLLKEKIIWNSHLRELRKSSLKRKLPPEQEEEAEIISVKLSGKTGVKEEKLKESDEDEIRCEYQGISDRVMNGNPLEHEIKQEVEDSENGDDVVKSNTPVVFDCSDVEIKSEDESEEDCLQKKDLYSKERILLSSSDEESEDEDNSKKEKPSKLNVGFNWDALNNRELLSGVKRKADESSSDDDEVEETRKKKKVKLTKAEREEKAREEEERLRKIEQRLMNADGEPETADDFDRALLGKPNSSALWVKYMAYHLQATEIEKARAVARRALKTIAFNEEQEKLNVWCALLNLENLYGSEETLNKTLSEALMCNEPYFVQLHMLNMHGQSSKFQEMEKVGNMMLKKFKDVDNLWEDVGLAYYKVGKLESGRHVLQRALPLLEKKKHVGLISKFAQMENKFGCSERAQTLYETVLANFPKRVDVWSCYVDMLVKSNFIDLARQVLQRATSQHLPPKKMKTLFKKFIAFEEKHGTPENVEKVRESAVEYVQTIGTMTD